MHGILKPTKNGGYYTHSQHGGRRVSFDGPGASSLSLSSSPSSHSYGQQLDWTPPHAQAEQVDWPPLTAQGKQLKWSHPYGGTYVPKQTAEGAMNNAQGTGYNAQMQRQGQYSYGSSSSYATPSQGNGSMSQQSPVTTQTSYNTTPSQTQSYSQPNTQSATPVQDSASSNNSNVHEGYTPASGTYNYPGSAPAGLSQTQSQSQEPEGAAPPQPTPSTRRNRSATVYGLKYAAQALDLSTMIEALKADIEASAASPVPECTTTELSLPATAMVPLLRPLIGPYADGGESDLPDEFKANYPPKEAENENKQDSDQAQSEPNADGSSSQPATVHKLIIKEPLKECPYASISSTLHVADSKARAIVQRAASRGIVQHIENLDGFRYSFNNAWSAKDEDGLRFSYICQDSMQNKDRHANGFTRTQKTLTHPDGSPGVTRGPRKPTYDCKGTVSVKFSAKMQAVVIQYRHYAIHGTVADRKKRQGPTMSVGEASGIRSLKRKRHSEGAQPHSRPGMMPPPPPRSTMPPPRPREPSLFELLQQSAYENAEKEGSQGQLGDAQSPWWGST